MVAVEGCECDDDIISLREMREWFLAQVHDDDEG